ncbi:MAG: hypothetical protein ACE5GM_00185, partial [bacterium]
SGEMAILHNMAMIADQKEDHETFLALERQSYRLAEETGNGMGLFQVGRVWGQVLAANGQKEEGVKVLRRSYEIGRQGGLPGTDQIEGILRGLDETLT